MLIFRKLKCLFVANLLLVSLSKSYAGDYSRAIYVPIGGVVAAASDDSSPARARYSETDGDCLKTVYAYWNGSMLATQQPDLNSNSLADALTDSIAQAVAGLQIIEGELLGIPNSATAGSSAVSDGMDVGGGFILAVEAGNDKSADVGFRITPIEGSEGSYLLMADVVVSTGGETSAGASYSNGQLSGSTRENVEFRKSIAVGTIETTPTSYEEFKTNPELNPSLSTAKRDVVTNEGQGSFKKTETELSEGDIVNAARQNGKKSLGFRDCDNEYKSLQEIMNESYPTGGGSGGGSGYNDSYYAGYYSGNDGGYTGFLPGDYDYSDPCPTCSGEPGELEVVEYYG